MNNKKILLVYYSRSGITKKIANDIQRALDCDVEEIIDLKKRDGILGFIIAGKDSVFGKTTEIGKIKKDPSDYDLVILGTPIWAGNMTCAIRTYITRFKSDIKNTVLFTTLGGSESQKAFNEMNSLLGCNSTLQRSFRENEIERGEYDNHIKEFVKKINDIVPNKQI